MATDESYVLEQRITKICFQMDKIVKAKQLDEQVRHLFYPLIMDLACLVLQKFDGEFVITQNSIENWDNNRERKMKYVNKPVVVEAFQFGVDEYPEWFKGNSQISLHEDYPNCCKIITLEGVMEAWKYDMIIKGIKGEIYPCKKDIFDASYESFKE